MAYSGSQTNSEFGAGINHVTTGRSNDASITLGGSLQADSDKWNATTPHAVLATAMGDPESSGLDMEGVQRLNGQSGAPGGFGKFMDELSGGSDNFGNVEE
jgi:hypothetical protein